MNERIRALVVGSVPLLLIHLFKGVCDVESTDLLVVLKLEKFVSTMASHIHENVGALVGQETLGSRDRGFHSPCLTIRSILPQCLNNTTSEHPNEILNSHFIATIVNLNVVTIKIQMSPRIGIYAARKLISQVTRRVIRQHQYNIRVGDAQSLHGSIPSEDHSLTEKSS